jgi:hypothetical protein
MPSYTVLEKGFYGGRLYDPTGKRRTLHVDTPFKKCPSWLKPIKAESAAAAKKRLTGEKANAKQVAKDADDVKGASFLDDPAAAGAGSTIETL